MNMAPSLSSIIKHPDLTPHHAGDHLHTLFRRHMSADVTTNVIFGVISGVIALIAIIQVAILAHRNRVLHCRLLHRDGSESAASSEEAQPATSQTSVSSVSSAPAMTQVTTFTNQQPRLSPRRTSTRPSQSTDSTPSAIVKPDNRILRRQTKNRRPGGSEAVIALTILLEQALRALTNSQCTSSLFIFDRASR